MFILDHLLHFVVSASSLLFWTYFNRFSPSVLSVSHLFPLLLIFVSFILNSICTLESSWLVCCFVPPKCYFLFTSCWWLAWVLPFLSICWLSLVCSFSIVYLKREKTVLLLLPVLLVRWVILSSFQSLVPALFVLAFTFVKLLKVQPV